VTGSPDVFPLLSANHFIQQPKRFFSTMAAAGLHFFLYVLHWLRFLKEKRSPSVSSIFSIPTIIFIAIFDTILNNHFGCSCVEALDKFRREKS
jgi:hypothetical protein